MASTTWAQKNNLDSIVTTMSQEPFPDDVCDQEEEALRRHRCVGKMANSRKSISVAHEAVWLQNFLQEVIEMKREWLQDNDTDEEWTTN